MSKEYISPERKRLEQFLESIQENKPVEENDAATDDEELKEAVTPNAEKVIAMIDDALSGDKDPEEILTKIREMLTGKANKKQAALGAKNAKAKEKQKSKDASSSHPLSEYISDINSFTPEAKKLIEYLALHTSSEGKAIKVSKSVTGGKTNPEFDIMYSDEYEDKTDPATFSMSYQDDRDEGQSDVIVKISPDGKYETYDWAREQDRAGPIKSGKIKENNAKQVIADIEKAIGNGAKFKVPFK